MPAPSRIASLIEVLRWLRDRKCMAVIAINHSTAAGEAKVLSAVARARARRAVQVMADDLAGLRRMRKMDAEVHLGLRFICRPPPLPDAKALGAKVLLPHWTSASSSFIARAHQAEMIVIPWTVDIPLLMRHTILDGADGVITNYPAKLSHTVLRIQKDMRARADSRARGRLAGDCRTGGASALHCPVLGAKLVGDGRIEHAKGPSRYEVML